MKPRNHVVLALLRSRKKSGEHKKSYKAVRRKQKTALLLFNDEVK